MFENITDILLSALIVVVVIGGIYFINKRMMSRYADRQGMEFRRQMIMLGVSLFGLMLILVSLPIISNELRGQLLGLVGILLSAAIALSATTFVGNIMAGIMLRTIEGITIGDFVRVSDHFGRITEMDLLHVEIQTEDRNLTTMPNMHLVTNPVNVLRKSGTIIGIEVGLGYDTHRVVIEKHLLQAAEDTGLTDPFVQIKNLGDFAVTYRIAGILPDLKTYIASHSSLKRNVLDQLHENGIEIMSPAFINTKQLNLKTQTIPAKPSKADHPTTEAVTPDNIIFDKAERAELHNDFVNRLAMTQEELKNVEGEIAALSAEDDASTLNMKKSNLEARVDQLSKYINKLEDRMSEQ
ncbi:MAG: mechanosensitive ion channel [Gammaproteobacteria bacterium]|nr:mechanosensitive ion channel family protein [Gammaproteobacteria bacterium]NNC96933.1 mechanosensitive ion channel [Gammaproteobacteria bacterium]NNM13348.1 mechanosensitive ion channel [Gammaproteobacteria bacterium]